MEKIPCQHEQQSTEQGVSQCKFYLKKKNRLCRFRPKPGQTYCPEHACVMGIQSERKRIPCPLNPNHNCYEDDLEKHVKKCNVTKIQHSVEKAVYYVKGINKGLSGTEDSCSQTNQVCVKDLTSQDLESLITQVKELYDAHVQPVTADYIQHVCVQEELCASGQEELRDVLKHQAGLRKELMQQAALIGQMDREHLFEHKQSCFIELGAGKGKLSNWINKATAGERTKFILVERGSVRYKMDGLMKKYMGENFKRFKMDIEDLHLGRVPELHPTDTPIIVGKHLCGGATDMGIRCAVNTLVFDKQNIEQSSVNVDSLRNNENGVTEKSPVDGLGISDNDNLENANRPCKNVEQASKLRDSPQGKKMLEDISSDVCTRTSQPAGEDEDITTGEPPVKSPKLDTDAESSTEKSKLPKGIVIALCCHHRCTWDTYVGRQFMEECGISEQQFDLLTRLSSWATCARPRVKSMPKHDASTESTGKAAPESEDVEDTGDHCSKDLMEVGKSSGSLREQLSVPEREDIGRLCKRLIDTGRLRYLQSKGMTAFLREYIDADTTPENVVLIAQS